MRTAWADAKLALTTPMGAIGTPRLLLRAAAVPLTRPAAELSPSGRGWQNEKPLAKRLYVASEMIGPPAFAGTRLRPVVVTVKSGDSTPSIGARGWRVTDGMN